MTVEPFDAKYIPLLAETVQHMWELPGQRDDFNRLYVEYIVRNTIYENPYAVQLSENGELCAAAFAARKNEHNDASRWLDMRMAECRLSDGETANLEQLRTYLSAMDRKTLVAMTSQDVKLSLFISRKRGCGAIVLSEITDRFRKAGFRSMYLWTDCTCNWEYYVRHRFELVNESVYAPLSSDYGYDFKTYVFRKKL